MVEDMDKKLEEIVNFIGLEVQDKMRDFVKTHTSPKSKTQNHPEFV